MIPILFGYPLHLWLGIVVFIMVVFQIAVARKILKVPFKWHRITGYLILVLAMIHGLIGMGLYAGIFTL